MRARTTAASISASMSARMSSSVGSVTVSGMERNLDCRRGSHFGLEQRNVERAFDAGNRVVDIVAKSLWTIRATS